MNFSNNLIQLRKKYKMSQEALAEKIGVTRQTIYKWETSATYPEMDKLVDLAKTFNISVDYLIDGNVEEPEEEIISKGEIVKTTKRFATWLGGSIGFILFGVAFIVTFSSESPLLGLPIGLAIIFASVLVIVCVAMKMDSFKKLNDLRVNFTTKEKATFHTNLIIKIVIGLALIFIGVAQLIFMGLITDNNQYFKYANSDFILSLSVGVLLVLIGIAVALFTQGGIMYDLCEEPDNIIGKEKKPTKMNELGGKICGTIMMVSTCIFLLTGFVWKLWEYNWIIFVIGGSSCGIVGMFLSKKEEKTKDQTEE